MRSVSRREVWYNTGPALLKVVDFGSTQGNDWKFREKFRELDQTVSIRRIVQNQIVFLAYQRCLYFIKISSTYSKTGSQLDFIEVHNNLVRAILFGQLLVVDRL